MRWRSQEIQIRITSCWVTVKGVHKALRNVLRQFAPLHGHRESVSGKRGSVWAEPSFLFSSRCFFATPYVLFLISTSLKVVTSLLYFKAMVSASCLAHGLTASLELPLWSKRVSGCSVLSSAVSLVGPITSEAIISYCFYLRTAKGESKYVYQVDQTLPPLTSRSEHPEDSCMPGDWAWSWSRTPKSPQLTKAQSSKGAYFRDMLENLGIETKHNFTFLNNETC